ncbi:MAG: DUF1573 domain-containing protein [Paludibacteraceae bacterium]|jgi:hypothetical protein|nr:DUF1573 domain-containing protein [Paludibacteraceae bacterium]MBO5989282.1 DUF1573 domain-containing protein [Paludibacteraceae bacterium]
MRKIGLFFAALSLAAASIAQEISFKEISHDFGTFPEEKGKVSCVFSFKNTGKADLVLNKVRASCGCTTPQWTKTPVAPGDTGIVTVTYNASGRPGPFTKTITVTSNAGDQRLSIKGEVIPKAKKVEDEYPIEMGGLRIKSQNVYMKNIEYPTNKSNRLMMVNNGKEDIKVSFKNVPSHIEVKASPESLKPGEKGTIDIVFNSKDANDWGAVLNQFNVVENGTVIEKPIKVHANVIENFAKLTPDAKANAPVLKVGNTVNVGEVKAKGKKTVKFSVSNEGKTDLIIRKASSNDENIKVEAPSKAIKPGKKGDIKITIANKEAGKLNSRVTIISNDPSNSMKVISLTGDVK